MSGDFHTIYRSPSGLDVRLEVSEAADAQGTAYLHHRLVVAEGRVGAVVLALRGDEILLVHSRRPAVGRGLWELPRGVGEAIDESAVDTARRELHEETGLHGRSGRALGRYITDSAVFPQEIEAVAFVVAADDEPGSGDGEIDDQQWVPVRELDAMIRSGRIQDAHSLAAIALWRAQQEEV